MTPGPPYNIHDIAIRRIWNAVVRTYLSPTPVRVGVGTSLIWAVDQTRLLVRVWLRETNPEEVRQGQKVINEMITCLCKLNAMEIIPEAFSPLYPWAFIIVINSLDSPDNMLANNALYP